MYEQRPQREPKRSDRRSVAPAGRFSGGRRRRRRVVFGRQDRRRFAALVGGAVRFAIAVPIVVAAGDVKAVPAESARAVVPTPAVVSSLAVAMATSAQPVKAAAAAAANPAAIQVKEAGATSAQPVKAVTATPVVISRDNNPDCA